MMKTTHFMQTWVHRFFYFSVFVLLSALVGCGGDGDEAPSNNTSTITLKTVAVTPNTSSLAKNVAVQLTAMGTYSDGTTKDISSLVTWASNSSNVSVNNLGKATAVAVGDAIITAVLEGVTGTSTVTVTPATLQSVSVGADFSLNKGQTRTLTATGVFSDGTSQDISSVVAWLSTTPAVATINNAGLVTAVSTGASIINATLNGVSGSANISVSAATLQSLSITPATPNLVKGLTQTLVATGTYSDGSSQALTTGVTWTSDKTTVATVTNAGLVTAVSAGSANISAKVGNISASTVLTVNAATLQAISITPVNPSIVKDSTQNLVATGAYSDGTSQALTTGVTWTSDKTTVATVTNAGLVTAVSAGSANISAKVGNISAATVLTVNAATLQAISIKSTKSGFTIGETETLSIIGSYSDGSSQTVDSGIIWTSSNSNVATITNLGLVTAVSAGSTLISAKVNNLSTAKGFIIKNPELQSIAIVPSNYNLDKGLTKTIIVTGTYSDGSFADLSSGVSWVSADTNIATITNSGLVTAINIGTTNITAKVGNFTASAALTVNPASLQSIKISPTNPSIFKGTSSLQALGIYSDGSSKNLTYDVIWGSDNVSVASVHGINGTGNASLIGSSLGTAHISALHKGKLDTITVTVMSSPVQ